MKTKVLLFVGLLFQFGFLLFVLMIAPGPREEIHVGLRRLKEEAPAQAVTVMQSLPNGALELKTAGDFFYLADSQLRLIIGVTIGFMFVTIITMILVLISLREKPGANQS